MKFTVAQMVELLLIHGECRRNADAAARLYNQRHHDGPRASYQDVHRVYGRLVETGALHRRPVQRPRLVATAEMEDRIRNMIADNPHTSSRAIAVQLNVSHQTVLRTLHRHRYHPYHLHLHQAMTAEDPGRRVAFCNWLDSEVDDRPAFLDSIMWTDEATFHRDGHVNLHNAHYWATVNPHWLAETDHQERFSVNVWCGILHDALIGPVFLPNRLDGPRYLQLLQEEVEDALDDVPLHRRQSIWYQHDGAPPHFSAAVRQWLNHAFPNRWIGRGGPVSWPPRSPDLTPLDFFLWGVIKERVYAIPLVDAADLRQRITTACREVAPAVLQRVRGSVHARIRFCIAAEGAHIEHLMYE